MSDNEKLKRLARARQAATGEAYTTARMNVRLMPEVAPSWEHRIRALLHMVAARDAEERTLAKTFGVSDNLVIGSPEGEAFLNAARPKEVQLKDALRQFRFEDLLKTLSIFYAGQDEWARIRARFDDLSCLFRHPDHVVEQLVQRRDLGARLENGLQIARSEGANLDESWPLGVPAAHVGHWDFRMEGHLFAALAGAGEWKRRPWVSRDEHDPVLLRREWMRREGVKESTAHSCLTHLARGRCTGFGCESLPGSDHTTFWNKDGKPYIYATQPYHLPRRVLDDMLRVCDRLGLRLRVDSAIAWHAPGAVLVEVFRRW